MHLEASTYSLLQIWRTAVRIIFAMLIQLVIPIANEILHAVASPKTACIKIITSKQLPVECEEMDLFVC